MKNRNRIARSSRTLVAALLFPAPARDRFARSGAAFVEGARAMFGPVMILVAAWILGSVLAALGTAELIARAAQAGVKLTPAGAAFPYGRDPEDRNIRLAPSYPGIDDVDRAMQVFVTCVQLCSVEQRLRELDANG